MPEKRELVVSSRLCAHSGTPSAKHLEKSWPICFDHIFNGPPAYWTACVDLSLQLQPAVIAQTHVSTGVDDRVHLLVKANGALPVLSRRGQFWGSKSGRHRRTERGAGRRHWMRERKHVRVFISCLCFQTNVQVGAFIWTLKRSLIGTC